MEPGEFLQRLMDAIGNNPAFCEELGINSIEKMKDERATLAIELDDGDDIFLHIER